MTGHLAPLTGSISPFRCTGALEFRVEEESSVIFFRVPKRSSSKSKVEGLSVVKALPYFILLITRPLREMESPYAGVLQFSTWG